VAATAWRMIGSKDTLADRKLPRELHTRPDVLTVAGELLGRLLVVPTKGETRGGESASRPRPTVAPGPRAPRLRGLSDISRRAPLRGARSAPGQLLSGTEWHEAPGNTGGCRLATAARLSALGWLLLAGGCGPGVGVYDKPGVTYEEWRRDDAECRRAAPTGGSSESPRDAYARCMRDRGYHVGDH
jgi:hypothetical protein